MFFYEKSSIFYARNDYLHLCAFQITAFRGQAILRPVIQPDSFVNIKQAETGMFLVQGTFSLYQLAYLAQPLLRHADAVVPDLEYQVIPFFPSQDLDMPDAPFI